MDMKHIFRKGKDNNQPTFIMFHGTGGDETDLIPVALRLNPDYNVLSVKGNVSEGGMARFFKRVGEGQYDWEDLAERSDELNAFLKEAAEHYNFDLDKAVLVGFSNGSNMAINLLLREDTTFAKALLFAPLYPTDIENVRDLSNMTIFLSMGTQDPIVPVSESERVIDIFKRSGAKVETHWTVSHGITEAALNDAAKALED
ncbi:carboxylesterase [Staphylococcus condimenti]|uniref:Alpha/beta hydrolase n=2 Tax=Staphylococcus condimenti TaxID=70255 RepID=A0A3S4S9M5_9STAP|nr:carboxylesterase [Staphylococcus condimenti]RZI03240.1 alpha/beta hydrolase [Staphylococcus condimenti]RZI03596.1 alpha/beta hydrolase [Staphylococcus condimenti]VEG65379.1 putative phospholipase/carboxylesterase [Staphylococcus condimenti]